MENADIADGVHPLELFERPSALVILWYGTRKYRFSVALAKTFIDKRAGAANHR